MKTPQYVRRSARMMGRAIDRGGVAVAGVALLANLSCHSVQAVSDVRSLYLHRGSAKKSVPMYSLELQGELIVRRTGRPSANGIAVIFGVEAYRSAPPAAFARNDAVAFKEYAVKVFGIPDDRNHALLRLDEEVTKGEMEKVLLENGWLSRRTGPESNVVVYFAGHGVPDPSSSLPCLLPVDGDPNYPTLTGLPFGKVLDALSRLEARSITVFIDACFSGGTRDSTTLFAHARPMGPAVNLPIPRSERLTVFAAAMGNQTSVGFPEKRHGLFTFYTLLGVGGEADANEDDAITVAELGTYIGTQVKRVAGLLDKEQTPTMTGGVPGRVLVQY
jgi:hypothetical protein